MQSNNFRYNNKEITGLLISKELLEFQLNNNVYVKNITIPLVYNIFNDENVIFIRSFESMNFFIVPSDVIKKYVNNIVSDDDPDIIKKIYKCFNNAISNQDPYILENIKDKLRSMNIKKIRSHDVELKVRTKYVIRKIKR